MNELSIFAMGITNIILKGYYYGYFTSYPGSRHHGCYCTGVCASWAVGLHLFEATDSAHNRAFVKSPE